MKRLLPMLLISLAPGPAAATPLPVVLHGTDFTGGAAGVFGSSFSEAQNVNMVYAQPTAEHATMQAEFSLDQLPATPTYLTLQGRDDDSANPCPIDILVNSTLLHRGESDFSKNQFQARRYLVPQGVLRKGTNTITISNIAAVGNLGQPPWFMLAACSVSDASFQPPPVGAAPPANVPVRIPQKPDSFIERAAAGEAPSGFKLRGTKGWGWTPAQYLAEIPVLARYHMNFLMNCYTSLFSQPPGSAGGWKNEWWLPLSDTTKRDYANVIRSCQDHDITFCFAMHPQLDSPRPLDPTSDTDFEQLWTHYDWAQQQGVHWFAVSLDDVSGVKISGGDQAHLVNRLLMRLREKDPEAQMVFCPTHYWGTGSDPETKPYLEDLARVLDPSVYVFWTGPSVVPAHIGVQDAEAYRAVVKHRLILWDNYPVNDGNPTLHLGPITGRDRDLATVIDGYMSNPHFTQNEINEIPLFTLADYAFAPTQYDPALSIGQAIIHTTATSDAEATLRDLVELFSGRIGRTADNALLDEYHRAAAAPDAPLFTRLLLNHATDVLSRLDRFFPNRYREAKATLSQSVNTMKTLYQAEYGGADAQAPKAP